MDGVTVSRFVHQLEVYFKLVELQDDVKRGQVAITLLEGPAYTWYSVQGGVDSWSRLRQKLLGYFKPADYAHKTRLALDKWTQRAGVTEYIIGFSERYTACSDVDLNEAKFRFINGLQPELQAWVRMQRPHDLQAAMQCAEEVGSTLAGVSRTQQKKSRTVAVPVHSSQSSGGYAPMELGSAGGKFRGKCYHCGREGHKAADCRSSKAKVAASRPPANRPNTSRQQAKPNFNTMQAALSAMQSLLDQSESSPSCSEPQLVQSAGTSGQNVNGKGKAVCGTQSATKN